MRTESTPIPPGAAKISTTNAIANFSRRRSYALFFTLLVKQIFIAKGAATSVDIVRRQAQRPRIERALSELTLLLKWSMNSGNESICRTLLHRVFLIGNWFSE